MKATSAVESATSALPSKGEFRSIVVQKTQEGPPPGPSWVSYGRRFSEVAPAASGPVSVCFLTIAVRGHLIHHPFSVDWPASRKISVNLRR
jgi:hypothetical protein